MIQVGICDDDMASVEKIEILLECIAKSKFIEIDIDVYEDGKTLLESIKNKTRFDIIYLDIQMKCLNGIEAAKSIREIDQEVLIMFISSYENYLMELFEVEPFRFIKKPVNEALFILYFNKAYEKVLSKDINFEYKYNKKTMLVPVRDIMYFESCGRVITIVKKDSTERFYGKLSQIEKQLENTQYSFLRTHQSYLINFKYVKTMSFTKVGIMNGLELQISEGRQKKIREKYRQILGETLKDE